MKQQKTPNNVKSNGKYFPPEHFHILESKFPAEFENKQHPLMYIVCYNEQTPEVAYLRFHMSDRSLSWEERRTLSILLTLAERRRNHFAEWNFDEGAFQPLTYLPDLLVTGYHKKDYAIIGVVGPSAEKYGSDLSKLIHKIILSD